MKTSQHCTQTHHCRFPPRGWGSHTDGRTDLPVTGGGVGEEGHVGGELAPEPNNENIKKEWISNYDKKYMYLATTCCNTVNKTTYVVNLNTTQELLYKKILPYRSSN